MFTFYQTEAKEDFPGQIPASSILIGPHQFKNVRRTKLEFLCRGRIHIIKTIFLINWELEKTWKKLSPRKTKRGPEQALNRLFTIFLGALVGRSMMMMWWWCTRMALKKPDSRGW